MIRVQRYVDNIVAVVLCQNYVDNRIIYMFGFPHESGIVTTIRTFCPNIATCASLFIVGCIGPLVNVVKDLVTLCHLFILSVKFLHYARFHSAKISTYSDVRNFHFYVRI